MAKIMIECADPNDLKSIEEAMGEVEGRCNITYFRQAEALLEAGAVDSERAAARKISGATGESLSTVRHRIQRGKKEVAHVGPPESTAQNHSESEKNQNLPSRGGVREGAGRKPKHQNAQKSKTTQVKVSRLVQLRDQVLLVANGLTLMADGILKHRSREDVEADTVVRNTAAHFIIQYSRMGVNVLALARFAVDGEEINDD